MRDDGWFVVMLLCVGFVFGEIAGGIIGAQMDYALGDQWTIETADGASATGAVTTDLHGILWVHRQDGARQPVLEGDVVRLERVSGAE